jgi:DNA invertase Pin-like site-specific DNA recombinase
LLLTKKRRIFAYARTSTEMQATGLESQVRLLRTYFEKENITDYEIVFDDGISGTKSSRPGLDRLMQAVRNNEVSMVVVPAFSRFARSTTHLLNALSEFKEKGVGFVSLSEKIDTNTPVGVAIFSILAAVSQLERDLIAERVKVGLQNARAKGKHIGRKKLRDSDLIRKLLKAKVTYRRIAEIAKCSHGAVHAEKVSMRKEAELQKQKDEEQKLQALQSQAEIDKLLPPEEKKEEEGLMLY